MQNSSPLDFNFILNNYHIGQFLKYKQISISFANLIYIVTTTNGDFILKLNTDKKALLFLETIKKKMINKKISIPNIILTKNNRTFLGYNGYIITLYKYIQGNNPQIMNTKLIKEIAKIQSQIHLIPISAKKASSIVTQKKSINIFSLNNKEYEFFNLLIPYIKAKKKLNHIENNFRKSYIHGDFTNKNILCHNNKIVAVIDWDEVSNNYTIFDISTFIAHFLIDEETINLKYIHTFFLEYEKKIKLNTNEKEGIYYLIILRLLYFIDWHIEQLKLNKKKQNQIKRLIHKAILTYHKFILINPKEFSKVYNTRLSTTEIGDWGT